jgi:hypothetical protein
MTNSKKSATLYASLIKKMAQANIHFISRYCNDRTNILQNLYKEEMIDIHNNVRKLFKNSKKRWILNKRIKTKYFLKKAIKNKLLVFPKNNCENYNIDQCSQCNKYGMTIYNDREYKCIDCINNNSDIPNYVVYLLFLQKINLESSHMNCFNCRNRAREVFYDAENNLNIFCRKCLN